MSTILDDEAFLHPRDREVSARRRGLAWLALGLLALLVFKLTADPALAVAVGCLTLGGDGLVTARWLRRNDPDRRRGRVVARFYTASAFWNVAGVATAMSLIVVQVLGPLLARWRGPGMNRELLGAFLVAVIAFALAGLLSLFAVVSAWRGRVKVWLGPQARRARRQGVWPPSLVDAGPAHFNGAILIVLVAMLAVAIPLGFAILIVTEVVVFWCAGPRPPLWPVVSAGVILPIAILFLMVRAVSVTRASLLGRIGAESPEECWPLDGISASDRPCKPQVESWRDLGC